MAPAFCTDVVSTDATSGTFSSPNYPGNYDNDLDCGWTISVAAGSGITFTIVAFETESTNDYLSIEGLASVLDGSISPGQTYVAVGTRLQVNFTSDGTVTDTGFQISYVFSR